MKLKEYIGVPGLYEYIIERVIPQISLGQDSKVLDLGAGSGAFVNYLLERYPMWHIEAADLELFESFKLKDRVKFTKVNLNEDFSSEIKGKFDLIITIEVIEHLENPRHLLRQCYKLLNPNGKLLITTPNIEAIPGRFRFLLKGNFRFFDTNPATNEPTHITPIQSYMFRRAVIDTGFKILKHLTYPERGFFNSRKVISFAAKIIAPLLKGIKFGDIHIFLLEKNGE